MINLKTALVFLLIIACCYCQDPVRYSIKKKKHHHHLRYLKFLHYLIFLAIKLKLVVFFGTIFTVGLVAAKIFAIIKATEYMKHKYHHHEEKIVYANPHEHHDFHGYSSGFSSPGDFGSGKVYSSSYPDSDVSFDQPPSDAYIDKRYGNDYDSSQYGNNEVTGKSFEGSYGTGMYEGFLLIARKLRSLNISEKAFSEMGIRSENCKKKFACEAAYNSGQNTLLKTGFEILSDDSYQKYKPNRTISSEEECDSLYECNEDTD